MGIYGYHCLGGMLSQGLSVKSNNMGLRGDVNKYGCEPAAHSVPASPDGISFPWGLKQKLLK